MHRNRRFAPSREQPLNVAVVPSYWNPIAPGPGLVSNGAQSITACGAVMVILVVEASGVEIDPSAGLVNVPVP